VLHVHQFKVRADYHDAEEIRRRAAQADHSVSAYLRLCALGRLHPEPAAPRPVRRAAPPRRQAPEKAGQLTLTGGGQTV
jgi:hypothetical protein